MDSIGAWRAPRASFAMIHPDLLRRMCAARGRLQAELDPPPRVRDVAAGAGMSARHFIGQFRALFGETPAQCRNRARLDAAREQLAGRESITQIALGLGYGSVGSFSRLFSRRFGCSPRSYRQAAAGRAAARTVGCVTLMTSAFAVPDFRRSGAAPDAAASRFCPENP